MLDCILPAETAKALDNLDRDLIFEIRLRGGREVSVNYGGVYKKLTYCGKTVKIDFDECDKIIARAAEYSLYSVNNQIVEGFVTVDKGVRIGLCGEIVSDGGSVKTVKYFSSLNVRIPHDVVGCADKLIKLIYTTKPLSTLVISPPGKGKTTMLRDLGRLMSAKRYNVLIVDERNEICAFKGGKPQFDTGENCDVITLGSKEFAFSYGVRTMSPDIIITDELMNESDAEAAMLAAAAGVKVVASVHADSIEELKSKGYLKKLLSSGLIERYVFLSSEKIGQIKNVYVGAFGRLL